MEAELKHGEALKNTVIPTLKFNIEPKLAGAEEVGIS